MTIEWDDYSGRGNPEERYALYRVCEGETKLELVFTCATPEAVGVALIEGGRDGEWEECPVGVLDRMPECETCEGKGTTEHLPMGPMGERLNLQCPACKGSGVKPTGTWVLLPWLPSPANVSAAGRVLRTGRRDVREARR